MHALQSNYVGIISDPVEIHGYEELGTVPKTRVKR